MIENKQAILFGIIIRKTVIEAAVSSISYDRW